MVNVLCLIWKNLHRAEKIYTGSARGARDKYEVWYQVTRNIVYYPIFRAFPTVILICKLLVNFCNLFSPQ